MAHKRTLGRRGAVDYLVFHCPVPYFVVDNDEHEKHGPESILSRVVGSICREVVGARTAAQRGVDGRRVSGGRNSQTRFPAPRETAGWSFG